MYILKYYVKSKYFTFKRVVYKEFKDYDSLVKYVVENNLPIGSYEIYENIVNFSDSSYNDNKEWLYDR